MVSVGGFFALLEEKAAASPTDWQFGQFGRRRAEATTTGGASGKWQKSRLLVIIAPLVQLLTIIAPWVERLAIIAFRLIWVQLFLPIQVWICTFAWQKGPLVNLIKSCCEILPGINGSWHKISNIMQREILSNIEVALKPDNNTRRSHNGCRNAAEVCND